MSERAGGEFIDEHCNAPVEDHGLDTSFHLVEGHVVLHQTQHRQLVCDIERLALADSASLGHGQPNQTAAGANFETAMCDNNL